MESISIRDLRNHGGNVLDRGTRGDRERDERRSRRRTAESSPSEKPVTSGSHRTKTYPAPGRPDEASLGYGRLAGPDAVTPAADRGLLDTSTVILLGRLADSESLPDDCLISTITLAEFAVGPLVAQTVGEQAARQAHFQQSEADFEGIEGLDLRTIPVP